jgi:hypothetical protein
MKFAEAILSQMKFAEMKSNLLYIRLVRNFSICINIKSLLLNNEKWIIPNKLSNEIQICISKEFPMKIIYELGGDSNLIFYIAPKVVD